MKFRPIILAAIGAVTVLAASAPAAKADWDGRRGGYERHHDRGYRYERPRYYGGPRYYAPPAYAPVYAPPYYRPRYYAPPPPPVYYAPPVVGFGFSIR